MENKIEIHITFDLTTGQTEVKGPLGVQPLICNILARAISAVIEHTPPVIHPANGNGLAVSKGQ